MSILCWWLFSKTSTITFKFVLTSDISLKLFFKHCVIQWNTLSVTETIDRKRVWDFEHCHYFQNTFDSLFLIIWNAAKIYPVSVRRRCKDRTHSVEDTTEWSVGFVILVTEAVDTRSWASNVNVWYFGKYRKKSQGIHCIIFLDPLNSEMNNSSFLRWSSRV